VVHTSPNSRIKSTQSPFSKLGFGKIIVKEETKQQTIFAVHDCKANANGDKRRGRENKRFAASISMRWICVSFF